MKGKEKRWNIEQEKKGQDWKKKKKMVKEVSSVPTGTLQLVSSS